MQSLTTKESPKNKKARVKVDHGRILMRYFLLTGRLLIHITVHCNYKFIF